MRVLFASYVPHMPESTGGYQTTIDALANILQKRGHDVLVMAGIARRSQAVILQERQKERFAVMPFDGLSYPLARADEPVDALPGILAGWQPDIVALPLGGGAQAAMTVVCLRAKVPVMLTVHNVDPREVATVFPDSPLLGQMANSRFTARRMHSLFGIDLPVVPPLIDPATCVLAPDERGQGDSILLINPSLNKGVDIFFRLAAARPELKFTTIESWAVSDEWRAILHNRAKELGNVELLGPTLDMRPVYRRTRLLLMPGAYEETWGKAATEAQLNGIPVIAAARGALPETVGAGGLSVPIDEGLEPWLRALDRVTGDATFYRQLSAAALAHATRSEFSADVVADRFIALLEERIALARRAATADPAGR
ncbi:MAG TPA: glycosyltransferase family 4 protein [Terriglobales bacterium]|nr:glycosyltransferase family 4 protein [Terriglobales bacterium]